MRFAKDGRVGTTLGSRWRLDRKIGSGGVATVFAATDLQEGGQVAVKVLHDDLAGDHEVRRRFLREGVVVNRIVHPGVVHVADAGSDGNRTYLVMDLLEGTTLKEAWQAAGSKMPARDVVRHLARVLDVVVAAHAAGILHRDLKADNIFITNEGELKLLDFGIARLRDPSRSDEHATAAGAMLGTPACMPPEQALGKWDEVDERADVYALGATAFRLLTGKPVHEAKSVPELLMAVATKPARPIRSVDQSIDPALASVIDRALAFDKTERWSNAGEMQQALREACPADSQLAPAPFSDATTTERTVPGSAATGEWTAPASLEPTTDRIADGVAEPLPVAPAPGPTALSPRAKTALMPHAKRTLASSDGQAIASPATEDDGATKRLGPDVIGHVLGAIGESKRSKAQSATAALVAATSQPRRAGTIPLPPQLPPDVGPASAATRAMEAPRAPATEILDARGVSHTPPVASTQVVVDHRPSPTPPRVDDDLDQATRLVRASTSPPDDDDDPRTRLQASPRVSPRSPAAAPFPARPLARPAEAAATPSRWWIVAIVIFVVALGIGLLVRNLQG